MPQPTSVPPPESLEWVDCNLCHWPTHRSRFNRRGFSIVECPNCSLWWVNPRLTPEAASRVYDEGYFQARNRARTSSDTGEADFKWINARQRLERLEPHRGDGRILDVGCGEGLFLRVAQANGWEVTGVELSPQAAAMAREALPGRIHQGTLRQADLPPAAFDVVSMFDVIEHFHDPVTELAEVHRLLKPGGVLCLLTPDCGSLPARLMGRFWFEVKPLEHLYYYSRRTVGLLLERTGFVPLETHNVGKVLTFEYIAQILDKERSPAGPVLRWATRWTPLYTRPIQYGAGFVAALAEKR